MSSVSFASPLSSPQQDTIRASGYWASVLACINPNTVVWQARAAESITDNPFITFLWDNQTVGDYTDVWEGMVAYISSTTDLRQAKYRGRVRLGPDSEEFFIDLNPTTLNDGDYITVIRDTDLSRRVRDDALVDGSIEYHDLVPQLANHPSVIILYDADNDGQETYTPAQIGIPVDADATVVDTWLWDVSGNGTYSIDDDTLEHPEFTFEAGYHYLLRVRYADDNDQTNYHIAHVYCITRGYDAPIIQPVVTGSIDGDRDEGWTASLTAYADVNTLLDRTHVALFAREHFGDNTSTPLVSNVWMNGRIRSDSIQTNGDDTAGVLQQVSFSVEGITAYLQRMRISNDIIRATNTPNEWGEIKQPNPYRMACYALWVYTTLTNICAFSVEDGAFEAYQIGGEPRGIDGGIALDVLTSILDGIKAMPNFAPSGEILMARNASYVEDRSGLEIIAALDEQDIYDETINRDSSRTTSQVIVFAGAFDSSANTFDLYTAQAPSIPYGDGGETRELTREILTADSTISEAQIEVGLRASNDFAYNNPKDLFPESLYDAYAGVMIPAYHQRWQHILAASSNTLGIAYTEDDFQQLQSVSLTINEDGSVTVSPEFIEETSFDDAQVVASLLPINLSNQNPILPVLPTDQLFPVDPLELYPTDDPSLDDLQPVGNDSAAQSYTPWPPDAAAQTAAAQGKPGCVTTTGLFKSSTNATSGKTSALGVDYLITASGISTYGGGWSKLFNFLDDDGGWVPVDGYGHQIDGVGFEYDDAAASGNYRRAVAIAYNLPFGTTLTNVRVVYDYTPGTITTIPDNVFGFFVDATQIWEIFNGGMDTGTSLVYEIEVSEPGSAWLIYLNASVNTIAGPPNYSGNARIRSIYVQGTGSNPFGPDELELSTDTFYLFDPENPDSPSSLLGGDEGLFIDNAKYVGATPPYSVSHVYNNLPFEGTGNPLLARMQFNDYSTKQTLPFTVTACRKNP